MYHVSCIMYHVSCILYHHTSYLSFFLHMVHFWQQFFSTQKARKSRQNRFHGKTA